MAEDEHEELFEEYAEELRAGRRVPGAGEFFDDLSGAPGRSARSAGRRRLPQALSAR
ncbi:hypothetical protein ACWEWX_18860 [Streptomyces asiaticus]